MTLIQNLLQTTTNIKDTNIIKIITDTADSIYIPLTNNIINKRNEISPEILDSLFSVYIYIYSSYYIFILYLNQYL